MTRMYVAMGDSLAVVQSTGQTWRMDFRLEGKAAQCVAVDPVRSDILYCGTFGQGLWQSDDGGDTWRPVGPGISHAEVMAVAVSALERSLDRGVVWAGTEPSALFRSEDGGRTWHERPSLTVLPSSPTWSFPPRPWTHHVRWIQPDPNVRDRLFVAIELGGVMRSLDGGKTWEDRKPGAQPDAHTLRMDVLAPGRVYEAAGGGFAESFDGGVTWRGFDDGLGWHYLWGLAVDPGNPSMAIVSASPGPRQAHGPQSGQESLIYRRVGDGSWQRVTAGLPESRGTMAYTLASNVDEPGVFYAETNHGLFRSPDAGESWQRLDLSWPDRYRQSHANGLVVVGTA